VIWPADEDARLMKARFQADADLKHAIVNGILRREPMIDLQTATAAGLAGLEARL